MRALCVALVLAAGCGKILPLTPDGGGGGDSGGGGDGSSSDPTVYLTVLTTDYSGQPDAAAIAVFQDPTGAVVRDGLVAADGTARAALPMGGSVTVIDVTMSSMTSRLVAITTIEDVRPGDHLTVGATKGPTVFTGASTMMTATFAPFSQNAYHVFSTSCGTSSGMVNVGAPSVAPLSFTDSCHGAAFDLLSIAQISTSPPEYDYVYQSGLPYAANGNVTVPDSWTLMNDFSVTMTNTPSNLSDILVTHSAYMGEINTAGASVDVTPTAGVDSATLPYPPVGTRALIQLSMRSTDSSVPGQQLLEDRVNSVTSSLGVDMSQLQLPWVGVPTETTTGVAWNQNDGGTPDARYVTWVGTWTDPQGVVDNLAWTIEDGKADHSLTLPALPASYAMYDPAQVTGVRLGRASVEYVDYANLAGYDQARPYGPNLTAALANLGVFVDQPVSRRISHTPLVARQ